jgi:hypothetical protein
MKYVAGVFHVATIALFLAIMVDLPNDETGTAFCIGFTVAGLMGASGLWVGYAIGRK